MAEAYLFKNKHRHSHFVKHYNALLCCYGCVFISMMDNKGVEQ